MSDLKPVKDNTDQEIKLEDDELHKLKILRNKLQTVEDLLDALIVLEKSIKGAAACHKKSMSPSMLLHANWSMKQVFTRRSPASWVIAGS